MAPAIVQAIKVKASTGTSVTLNNAWTVTAGNTLHAFMACWGAGASASNANNIVSSDVNGTWTFGSGAGSNNAIPHGSQHYKLVCAGGLEDLTANGGTQVDGITAIFHEISGAPILVAGELASSDSGGATTNPQTGSETNSVANAIYLVSMGNAASNNPATATLNGTGSTPSSGWALHDSTNSQELNGTTAMVGSVAFLVASTSSARAHGWTTGSFRANDHIIAFSEYRFLSIFCCGFECGQIGSVGQHWQVNNGTATFSTTTVRNGARSLRFNAAGSDITVALTLPSATLLVGRVAIRFATLPSGDVPLVQFSGSGPEVRFQNSDSTIRAGVAGTVGASGVVVTTNTWYYIDFDFFINTSGNDTANAKVNGTAVGQASATGTSSATTTFIIGVAAGVTADVFFDDVILSTSPADYPIGDGYVNHFVPVADGTHNIAGAADFKVGAAGADITNASTTAFQLIDEVPLDDTTADTNDYINMIAPPNAGDYTEHVLGPAPGISTPTVGPRAVECIIGIHQAGATAGNMRVRLNDNGTEGDIYSATAVVGTTTIIYKRAHFADPPSAGSTWHALNDGSNGDFRDLRVRFGSPAAVDANPDQYLDCVMIEAEFAVVAPSNVQPPRSMHQFRLRRAA